jgi:hypothetical protein
MLQNIVLIQPGNIVKRIMRYLKGTLAFGLCYRKSALNQCVGYSDADWAGDVDDRHSTSDDVFLLSGLVVSRKSKKQSSVALSTAEAEYVALSSAAHEALWLRQLLADLSTSQSAEPILIFEDNLLPRTHSFMVGPSTLTSSIILSENKLNMESLLFNIVQLKT